MHPVTEFKHDKKYVPLTIPQHSNYYDNTFTLIVGKNGVGKSRLLSSMVKQFVEYRVSPLSFGYVEKIDSSDRNEGRIIAVSTSPFDKFKIPIKNSRLVLKEDYNYRYIGIRSGGAYGSSAISLISSATRGILDKFVKNEGYDRLRGVFKTLGFLPEVRLMYKPNFSMNGDRLKFGAINSNKKHVEIEWLKDMGVEVHLRALDGLNEIGDYEIFRIRNAIAYLRELHLYGNGISIELDFAHGKEFSINRELFLNTEVLESISVLVDFNLIRLMDMQLHKLEYGDLSLRRASSGEQCMLVMMLGIAGHIQDESLVFIDEPEISLHPKWQEEFMPLLIKTFSEYRACQFFIATHSPQIVSRLKGNNCFVTSLTNNEIYLSSYFTERSCDFQLAELFDAPGLRNEYITRLAFTLLSKVKSKKEAHRAEIEELGRLLELCHLVDRDDPIFDLIKSVEEVVLHYASY